LIQIIPHLFWFKLKQKEKIYILILTILAIIQVSCVPFQAYSDTSNTWSFHEITSNDLPLKILWEYELSSPATVPPINNDDTMFILQTDGIIKAINLTSGILEWEYNTGEASDWPWSENPYDVNKNLLTTVIDNSYYILIDANSGEEIRRTKLNYATKTVPDILLIDDIVVISSFSVDPTTEGYIVGYDLETGKNIFEKFYPSRSFEYSFKCPNYSQDSQSSEYTICVSLYDHLDVIDFDPQLEIEKSRVRIREDWKLASNDRPLYQEDLIFFNPSPKPAIQVLEVNQGEQFMLFEECAVKKVPHSIKAYQDMLLASTGCNEVYTLDINSIGDRPAWVYKTTDTLKSSFVTLDGNVGYFLNDKAEIVGVNLNTGTIVGKFVTNPTSLEKGKYLNSLTGTDPYLYALFNGHQVFVFEQ